MSETLESTFIKVPFESLKRTTRDRKYAIDELKDILRHLKTISGPKASQQEAIHGLEECLRQLQRLKRKLDETSVIERDEAQRCQARLEHLNALGRPIPGAHLEWNRQRIDRLLVDYMLRSGYIESAKELSQRAGLDQLTDLHIFTNAQRVLVTLKAHDCTEALSWCAEHATRLRKAKSPLEFRLRVQEFVELIRNDNVTAAIAYARLHLTPWAELYPQELRQAAALLAFRSNTQCPPYAALFSAKRWVLLINLFKSELFRLHSLPQTSLLEVHLQAGLSALKTPMQNNNNNNNNGSSSLSFHSGNGYSLRQREYHRYKSTTPSTIPNTIASITSSATTITTRSSSKEDPLHLATFQKLAEGLPSAKHVHSKLICALTGKLMTEHNPPMVLPNGYVYSEQAVMSMAEQNEGKVTCPCTGAVYEYKDLRRAYVM